MRKSVILHDHLRSSPSGSPGSGDGKGWGGVCAGYGKTG